MGFVDNQMYGWGRNQFSSKSPILYIGRIDFLDDLKYEWGRNQDRFVLWKLNSKL